MTRSRAGAVARHALRVAAMGGAAFCAASTLTGGAGIAAAVIGACLGVVTGELLAGRRLRLWIALVGSLGVAMVGLWLAGAATRYELLPDLLGPARALRLSVALRFGLTALALAAGLRIGGRRVPALAVVELAAVVMAFSIPFAAHRDGVLVRPLWLSDWAWHEGIDPAVILSALGAVVAGVLALLLMLESDRRVGPSSFVALPAIAAVLAIVIGVVPPPSPQPTNDLGLTVEGRGDPPRPSPPRNPQTENEGQGANPSQGQQGQQQQGQQQQGQQGQQQQQGQQGQQQQQGQQGQQQQGQQQQGQQQGQQQQQGQGSQRPPAESDWQEPSEGNQSAPMAIVILGDDYIPPAQMYYFRQEAWSEYVGNRLVAPRRNDRDRDVPGDLPRGTLVPPAPASAPGNSLLRAEVALLVQHRRLFFLGEPTLWEPLTNPDPSRFVRAYRFEAVVSNHQLDELVGREAGAADWTPDERDYYLRQSDDPRFAKLAKEIVDAIPEDRRADPFVRAAAIKSYLDENTIYSTKHRHAGVPDPTADFLFGDRTGYCVHFAHAAAYLWRSAGIPARVGVGYAVQADSLRGSSLLVRGGDAHAWPELYLRGIGWVVLDISAKQNLDPPGTPPDDDMQEQLAELARGARPDPFQEEPVTRKDGASLAAPAGMAIAALLAAALLLLYAMKIWRRVAPRFAPPAQLARVGYRAALDRLAEAGRRRDHGETRERFADRLAVEVPAFVRVTDLHLAARFAPPPAPAGDRAEWLRLLAGLRRELAGRSSPGRRLARALDPISFLAAR